jgi:hypothetical protein
VETRGITRGEGLADRGCRVEASQALPGYVQRRDVPWVEARDEYVILNCMLFFMLSSLHSELSLLFLANLCSRLFDHPLASIFLHGDKDPEPVKRLHKHECENERVSEEIEGV